VLTVGVTGTNGKTTTTSWIAAALASDAGPVVRITTLGLYLDDEKLEVPTTHEGFLQAVRRGYDRGGRRAAIEYTSEALALGFARAWPVRVAVFTNLTHDHLDAHGSPEHYLASKAQLFLALPKGGTAVLNAADPSSALLAEVLPEGVRIIRYGVASRGTLEGAIDVRASAVTTSWKGTHVAIEADASLHLPAALTVRAIGDVFAENALAALCGAVAAGVDGEEAARRIAAAPAPAGRFEVVAERPFVVVDYAHSPDALARTVTTARALCDREDTAGKLWVVFGAGGNRDKAKRAPMGTAAMPADHVVLTTDNPRDEDPAVIAAAIREGLVGHEGIEVELDRAEAIRGAILRAGPDDVVLVAGKGHETDQTIAGIKRHLSDVEIARSAHTDRASAVATRPASRSNS
jgi:UDP-N-acetylmuramoyl-L-alanyl-D-glutamate--2,6-diaminopimelate ligase